ncbi:follistatin-related protein 5-like isoform X2 [Tubulanus polymorphus]|uniref:follistatin-related protein 5-like isoform X2 n=1 Tax=Tubulanus polymorphus TaxID=672921 RepID=UPI003DA44293
MVNFVDKVGIICGLLLISCHAKPYPKEAPKSEGNKENAHKNDVFKTKIKSKDKGDHWMSWTPEQLLKNADKYEHSKGDDNSGDPCEGVWCHQGRVCAPQDGQGVCVCGDKDLCLDHHKPVCGDDNVMYPSHCELHRMACVKNIHIGVDHTGKECSPEAYLKEAKKENSHRLEELEEFLQRGNDDIVIKKKIIPLPGKKNIEQENDDRNSGEITEKKTGGESSSGAAETDSEFPVDKCVAKELTEFKNNLIAYHCSRIGEENCDKSNKGEIRGKPFLANVMFTYYDDDLDGYLSGRELQNIEHKDHLERLSETCGLSDLLLFDDSDKSGQINLDEFFKAFNISRLTLDEELKFPTVVSAVGGNLELSCDIQGVTKVVWTRNNVDLSAVMDDTISVLNDGSLYIRGLELEHMGNYSCHDTAYPEIVQTHYIKVQVPPKVRVAPNNHVFPSGSTVTLRCHADGLPRPRISWEKNNLPLPDDPDHKLYTWDSSNTVLSIKHANYSTDIGSYKCKGTNIAGEGQDTSTIFITDTKDQIMTAEESFERFVVFHDNGYTVYEPQHCHQGHTVNWNYGYFRFPPGDDLKTLCKSEGQCSWGSVVNVKNTYLYISQPNLNRVVVIGVKNGFNPIQVIKTEKVPVHLRYIEHLDQVWVVCWNANEDSGSKLLVAVRDASKDLHHEMVHPQPMGRHFDLLKDVFLPPSDDLKHKFRHGYVTHFEKMALYKLDLARMQYVNTIDLKQFNCVPKSVGFLPIGGQILIECKAPIGQEKIALQLVMDYVTDQILQKAPVPGSPNVSPDGKYIVSVDPLLGAISVQKVTEEATWHTFRRITGEVTTCSRVLLIRIIFYL